MLTDYTVIANDECEWYALRLKVTEAIAIEEKGFLNAGLRRTRSGISESITLKKKCESSLNLFKTFVQRLTTAVSWHSTFRV
jgi:hypothetical protein